jgi:hypothetical protein
MSQNSQTSQTSQTETSTQMPASHPVQRFIATTKTILKSNPTEVFYKHKKRNGRTAIRKITKTGRAHMFSWAEQSPLTGAWRKLGLRFDPMSNDIVRASNHGMVLRSHRLSPRSLRVLYRNIEMCRLPDLMERLNGGVVKLWFTKQNGELRTMFCTRESSEFNDDAEGGHLKVYDVEAKDWRAFRIDSIITVNDGFFLA